MKEQLENLLLELKEAFEKSDIKDHIILKMSNRIWNYELIITALEKNQPLIIGFNWGVDNSWDQYISGKEYKPQAFIEKRNFLEIYKGSIKRVISFIEHFFEGVSLTKANHSNFCLFRSERENQISEKDANLCKPIFEKLIKIVEPSIVFCFSSKARHYMLSSGLIKEYDEKIFQSEGRGNSCTAAKGQLSDGTNIYFLPHPNYRLKKELRKKAWEFCSK